MSPRVRWLIPLLASAAMCAASSCTTAPHKPETQGTAATARTSAHLSPSAAASESAPLPDGSIAWRDCGGGFQCGTLSVPVDYTHPHADHIGIAMIRRPATDSSARIGSLLLDPGGPGASGVAWLRSAAPLFSSLNERFDLVAFDPRGVAGSAPVRCLNDAGLDRYFQIDPAPTSAREKQRWITANKRYDRACVDGDLNFLRHVSSADTATDMELMRRAMHDRRLTYMGFSYGTFLGEMYASLFPRRVRALALDAVIPPHMTLTQLIIGQARGFSKDLDDFFSWCRTNGCSLTQFGDPSAAFTHLVRALKDHPIAATGGRDLTLGEAEYGIAEGLYDTRSWPGLAAALTRAAEGSGSELLALFDNYAERDTSGHYSNEFDSYNAIICVDHPAPKSAGRYEELANKLQRRYGPFGSFIAWQSLPCAFWPVPAEPLPTGLESSRLAPILYVGGTNDPATPYVWATQAHEQTRGSVLLTRVGDGHTSYGKSTCVHDAVDRYLTTLKLPPRHYRCEGT